MLPNNSIEDQSEEEIEEQSLLLPSTSSIKLLSKKKSMYNANINTNTPSALLYLNKNYLSKMSIGWHRSTKKKLSQQWNKSSCFKIKQLIWSIFRLFSCDSEKAGKFFVCFFQDVKRGFHLVF